MDLIKEYCSLGDGNSVGIGCVNHGDGDLCTATDEEGNVAVEQIPDVKCVGEPDFGNRVQSA